MSNYFLPFLSLIIIGLIAVLVFQIVDYFQSKRLASLENKAAVKVVAGRAEMKPWGVEQWTNALDGSILREGDAIRTAPGSRVILSLLNGSLIRLSSETEMEFTGLKSRDAQDDASINVINGEIWLKRAPEETVRAVFKAATPHFNVTSVGTVFNVSKGAEESVRVIEGKVNAEVKIEEADSADMRVVETLEVAFGQEINLGPQEIADLKNKKPVQFLSLLSDEFRASDWYSWNRAQDKSGNAGITVAEGVASEAVSGFKLPLTESAEAPPVEITGVLSAPEILSPPLSERTTRLRQVVISGKTSPQTEKIEVTTYIVGKEESYALQKYKPGSGQWTYVASPDYGNFSAGENRFTVVAIGKDGKRSEAGEISIFYDKPKEPSDLSAAVVSGFNGSQSSETTEDVVKVEGKIGKGIVKVFVNDFALTRYVPDSGAWTYYAKTAYGNLKEGENEYFVYGVDYEGNKTPIVKFTITKKPKPVQENAPAPPVL